MDELNHIRKLAANRYQKHKVIRERNKPVYAPLPTANYIFNKVDNYYIKVDDSLHKIDNIIRVGNIYSSNKHNISEFGRSVKGG